MIAAHRASRLQLVDLIIFSHFRTNPRGNILFSHTNTDTPEPVPASSLTQKKNIQRVYSYFN